MESLYSEWNFGNLAPGFIKLALITNLGTGNFMLKKMGKIQKISIFAVAALALTGCTTNGGISNSAKGNTAMSTASSSTNSPISVSADSGHEPKIGQPSGSAPTTLVSHDVIVGKGAVALSTSTLTVHYVLMSWSTGKVIQSSWTTGSPATFALAQVIPGWQQGMPGMHEGGRRLLIIPPALGYGANGAGPIGPNETLVFVVDLIKVA